MPRISKHRRSDSSAANLGCEAKLWLAADKLRNNVHAAKPSGERHTAAGSPKSERGGENPDNYAVLCIIFQKYISGIYDPACAFGGFAQTPI